MISEPDKLAPIATQVIEQRRQFAKNMQVSFDLSPEQWEPLGMALAITGESRFNVYFYYPYLFQEAFLSVSEEILRQLAWCGRAALDYILLYDYLLDTTHSPNPIILLGSYAFQREWLRGLQYVFPPDSSFWDDLNRCEAETSRALLDEQARRQAPLASFTMDDVRRQAIGKAALSRLAIIALGILTNPTSHRIDDLIRSNDHYNFARQVVDDLLDWRRDYTARRMSHLLSSALLHLGLDANTQDDSYPEANVVGSVLYTQIAPAYLGMAEDSLNEAIDLAHEHGPCPHWLKLLDGMAATIHHQQAVIAEVIMRSGQKRIQTIRADHPGDNDVTAAIKAAAAFLQDSQTSQGCWQDFATSAGESDGWITGYVGWAMHSTGHLSAEALQRAVVWLQDTQFPEGGWGYRRDVVIDADSTAWCLRFLCRAGLARQDLEKALAILLDHQHPPGGFSTYSRPDDIRTWMEMEKTQDFAGWCNPQMCVTAVATTTLLELGLAPESDQVLKAIEYLLANQQPDGTWHSYWWTGPHYATAHTLQAIACSDNGIHNMATLAQEWLLNTQRPDGGWSCAPNQPSTSFDTALALQGLLVNCEHHVSMQDAVDRGVTWLTTHQEQDGSWRSSAMLLLPQTDETQPWRIKEWPVSIHGTGIARRDHRRLFTTASVLVALSRSLILQT